MHSGAASQGGGWWQGCGAAYGEAEGCADDDRGEDELKLTTSRGLAVGSWYTGLILCVAPSPMVQIPLSRACLLYNETGCWVAKPDIDAYLEQLQAWRGPFDDVEATINRSKLEPFCPAWCEAISGCCVVGHGNANEIVRLSAPDAAVLGLTTNGGVLRMSRMLGKDDHVASSTILTYRLGELGVGPRVHAAWIESGVCAGASAAQIRANPLLAFESSRAKCTTEESSKLKLFLVAEPFMPLYQLLTLVNGSQSALRGASGLRLEDELIGHFRQLAELGLLFVDAHAGNVLVRPATYTRHHLRSGYMADAWDATHHGWNPQPWERFAAQAWESRLTDFDRGLVPTATDLNIDCRMLLMLTQMALTIARFRFGPRAAFQSEIRRLVALPTVWEDGCANALGFNQTEGQAPAPHRRHDTRAASNQLQRFVFHAFAISQSLSKDPADVSVELGWTHRSPKRLVLGRKRLVDLVLVREDVIQTFPELQWRWSSGLPPL